VLDAAKGGVATAWMLYEMQARGVMPAAAGAQRSQPRSWCRDRALADFTMISGFDCDITRRSRTARWFDQFRTPSRTSSG